MNGQDRLNGRHTFSTLAFVPLRLVLGIIFIAHGGGKLFGLFGGSGPAATAEMFAKMGFFPPNFWAQLAGMGEFIGGIFVLLGLFTRLGALAIAVTMAVAILKVHWSGGLLGQGGFEYPLACLAMALTLFFGGSGPWISMDSVLFKKK